MTELSDRLALIESRAAIADLVHAYARAVRHGKPGDVAALFTEDAFFEILEGWPTKTETRLRTRLDGRAAILAYLSHGDAASATICPLIHNLMIEIDGTTARANSVLEARMLGTDHTTTGEYRDTMRLDGKWLFTSRTMTMFIAPKP